MMFNGPSTKPWGSFREGAANLDMVASNKRNKQTLAGAACRSLRYPLAQNKIGIKDFDFRAPFLCSALHCRLESL
jgi:hypothetical protein